MTCRRVFYLAVSVLFQLVFGPRAISQTPSPTPEPARSATWVRADEKLDQDYTTCNANKIDTIWAVENHPLEIERHSLRMTEVGTSDIDFYARNLERSPIEAVALVMEYTDEQGRIIQRLPAVSATKEVGKTFHPPFAYERVTSPWITPIVTGESVRIQGVSNGVRAIACPSHARVTFVMVQFSDGTIKKLSAPGWQLEPTPFLIPFVPRFSPDVVKVPSSLLAEVRIDLSGHVVDVVSQDPHNRADLLIAIRDQMIRSWKFNPGLRDGEPSESEITVLFRIHTQRTLDFPETKPIPSPVTLVDFFPDDRNPGKLQIAYGRLFSGSSVE